MQQVLFHIPITFFGRLPEGIPIYGFGVMLFLAFIICTWLGGRRAIGAGFPKQVIQDMAIWVFLGGVIGARLAHTLVEDGKIENFFRIWDGGLVFYGCIPGGVLGYFLAYYLQLRPLGISNWKMADVIAPAVPLGLCLGRIGCFLTGCCYGNVACANVPQVHFPLAAPPRVELVQQGFQTAAGFTWTRDAAKDERTVGAVEPDSPAEASGLRPDDIVVKADGHDIRNVAALGVYLVDRWPRGKNDIQFTVERGQQQVVLPAFVPRTIGLHPAQLYSSFGGFVVFLLLLAYEPFRKRDGELMALLMMATPLLRFFEEAIRNDTPVLGDGMTFSQNVSILFFVLGLGLMLWLRLGPQVWGVSGQRLKAVPVSSR
jgi:phosphatidylglycerol---prolipoprotein diacylglyceryl transferase